MLQSLMPKKLKLSFYEDLQGLPQWHSGKEKLCLQCRSCRRLRFGPWVRKIPWRREWQPTPLFLPEEFHGQRSLTGCSPWGHKEQDTTERLSLTHSYKYIIIPLRYIFINRSRLRYWVKNRC